MGWRSARALQRDRREDEEQDRPSGRDRHRTTQRMDRAAPQMLGNVRLGNDEGVLMRASLKRDHRLGVHEAPVRDAVELFDVGFGRGEPRRERPRRGLRRGVVRALAGQGRVADDLLELAGVEPHPVLRADVDRDPARDRELASLHLAAAARAGEERRERSRRWARRKAPGEICGELRPKDERRPRPPVHEEAAARAACVHRHAPVDGVRLEGRAASWAAELHGDVALRIGDGDVADRARAACRAGATAEEAEGGGGRRPRRGAPILRRRLAHRAQEYERARSRSRSGGDTTTRAAAYCLAAPSGALSVTLLGARR